MAATLAMLLSASLLASPLSDLERARSLALSREIAAREGIRIFEIPTSIGDCWGPIESCPDVELVVTFVSGDLYDPPVAYSLPISKGWIFVGWKGSNSFVVRTSVPDSNIDEAARAAWRPVEYTVTVGEEGASYSVGAPD